MTQRIAIIGAGPSGMAALRAFESAKQKGAEIPELVCYEKQDDWGGIWNYTWRTGTDEYGEPVHGSMYRYLWSNGPKECLEFADYSFEEHFGRPIPSYPPRAVLHDYIKGRVEKSGVRKYMKFRTPVRNVTYNDKTQKFTVTVKDLKEDALSSSEFDWVICSSGHFYDPNVPEFPGLAQFQGRVMHAHDFRSADEFAGKNVPCVGSSYSSEDIGIQCHKYGAKSVTFSHRTRAMGFKWPDSLSEVPLLVNLEGKIAHFKDGTSKEVDAIVLCTGYLHHYPFLDDSLRLKSRNRLYPPSLYKGVFWWPNNKFIYLGAQDQYYTFNMFDAQAWYARDVILGRIKLPGFEEQAKDINAWIQREEAIADAFEAIDFQTEYVRDLLGPTDYPRLDVDMVARLFKEWEHHKMEDILTYRDRSYPSTITGNVAPVHHTPWMKALDDSMQAFLNQPDPAAAKVAQRDRGTMAPPTIITLWSPEVILPGRPALDSNVERYTVAGGGSSVFALDAGDRIDIAPIEGGQPLELLAFAKSGKPDLGALGLQGKTVPTALHTILASDREDAARVRFGLFRRGIDIGRAKAATLFNSETPPGEIASFTAERAVVVVIAAPAPAGTVWDQASATDTLVLITRTTALPPQLREPPEPLAEPRLDLRINVASSIGFEVYEGEYIQIVDIAGRQCSDFLAFERRALDAGRPLPLDSTTTRTMSGLAYPKPGLASRFYDRDRNPLVEVVQDTVGRHDTFGLACTSRTYEDAGYFGHANCSDNLNVTMAPYAIDGRRGWPAINFFYNTNVDHQNQIWFDEPWSRPGDYVLMRALSDLVCAATSCPDDIDPANGWQLTEIQVRVYPKTATSKRAMGYRMTADAPLQMTKETGFHPRTSELTRTFGEYRGYWVPHRFTKAGPIEEYWACREKVVIIDLSPLRKLEIMGPDAESFLQSVFPRDIRKLSAGQIFYTALCYEHGGMVDDGTLFRMCQNNFRWIGGDDASLLWLREQAAKSGANVLLKSATNDIHNVAVQGPKSRDTLRPLLWTPGGRPTLDELGVFRFTIGRIGGYDGIPVIVSRTGYTGEQGYEVFCHPKDAPAVWDAIMQSGAEHGIRPFGFDALDMVRIEAGLAFGGYEFDSTTDPFEAGIGFTVPTKKEEDYIGKAALERRRAAPARKLVGLEIAGNEPAGHGDKLYAGRAEIGVVTSGMRSPLLKKTIALARVDVAHAEIGTKLAVGKLDGHIKRLDAIVVRFPFYDPEKTRVRS